MKRLVGIIISFTIIVFIIICSINECLWFKEKKYFNDSTMEEVELLLQSGNEGIIYFGSPKCSMCKEFSPLLKEYVENYSKIIYYIDSDNDEFNDFVSEKNLYLKPTLLFIEDSQVMNRYEGSEVYGAIERNTK